MPELPDITIYVERLLDHVSGERLNRVRIGNPFLVRTVDPPVVAAQGLKVESVTRLNKRVVIGFEDDLFFVIHLMIAGRLRWKKPEVKLPKGSGLAAFDFDKGSVVFTEAGKKRRASLHVVRGEASVTEFDRGGVEILKCDIKEFAAALRRENHTLKRALTDQRIVSGIGNAYSDEILHRARMSPFVQTSKLSDDSIETLYQAARATLEQWIRRLRADAGNAFPDKVTAFRPEMAVHGKYNEPCPVCEAPVQRIRYAENEANYCARCQTDGRVLADRSLSRLLKSNWPKRIEDLM